MSAINITIVGDDNDKKDAVSNIISNALQGEGFTNVALVNSHGEPMAATHVPTVLETLAKREPEFFGTKIDIWARGPLEVAADATAITIIEDKEQ